MNLEICEKCIGEKIYRVAYSFFEKPNTYILGLYFYCEQKIERCRIVKVVVNRSIVSRNDALKSSFEEKKSFSTTRKDGFEEILKYFRLSEKKDNCNENLYKNKSCPYLLEHRLSDWNT